VINFIANHETDLKTLLKRFGDSSIPISTVLGAVVPLKIALFILKKRKLNPNTELRALHIKDINNIMELLSAFTLQVEGVRGFEFCQLSTGGIPLTEVDQQSLESKILPGLFFAGEVLDVHGPCGGYNLQWAFSSGVVVGRHAALTAG
jgi:predicted flavoprotein YhiN